MRSSSIALRRTIRLATGFVLLLAALAMLYITAQSYGGTYMVIFPFGRTAVCEAHINRGHLGLRVNVPISIPPSPRMTSSLQYYRGHILPVLKDEDLLETHEAWGHHISWPPGSVRLDPLLPGLRAGTGTWWGIRATHVAFSPAYPFAIAGVSLVAGLLLLRKRRPRSLAPGFPIMVQQAER
jgi:hypothetical protein